LRRPSGWVWPFVISLLCTLWANSYVVMFFFYPVYLRKVGLEPWWIGLAMGSFYGATAVVRPTGGVALERMGWRRTAFLSFALMFLSSLGVFGARGPVGVLASRVLGGFGYGLALVALTAYQSVVVPARARGGSFAWVSVCYVLPQVVFLPLVEISFARDFHLPYRASFSIFSLLFLVFSLRLREVGEVELEEGVGLGDWGGFGELLRTEGLFVYLFASFLFGAINGTVLMFTSTLASERGLSSSLFLSLNALVAMSARVFGNSLLNRANRFLWLGPSMGAMVAALGLLPAASTNLQMAAVSALYGLGMAVSFPFVLAMASDLVPLRLRPKASSLAWVFMDLSWLLVPLLVGAVSSSWGVSSAFRLVFVSSIPSLAVLELLLVSLARRYATR